LITICIVAVLFYVLSILRDVRSFTNAFREEGDLFREDLASARSRFRERGFEWGILSGLIASVVKRQKERRGRRKSAKKGSKDDN